MWIFCEQFHTSVTDLEASPANQFSDISAKIKSKMKDLSNVYTKILYCLDDLGLICAHEVKLGFTLCFKLVLPFFFFSIVKGRHKEAYGYKKFWHL